MDSYTISSDFFFISGFQLLVFNSVSFYPFVVLLWPGAALNVVEPLKQAKKGAKYLNSGTLHATYCYIEENPTFSDVSALICLRANFLHFLRWLISVTEHLVCPSFHLLFFFTLMLIFYFYTFVTYSLYSSSLVVVRSHWWWPWTSQPPMVTPLHLIVSTTSALLVRSDEIYTVLFALLFILSCRCWVW